MGLLSNDNFYRRKKYVWLDTLPDINEEPEFVPLVERYTYCKEYTQMHVLEELLVVYGLRMDDVLVQVPRRDWNAIVNLALPKQEYVAVDLRPYGYERILYFMTKRQFRSFLNNNAILLAKDCMIL